MSTRLLGWVSAGAAIGFAGYCVYFDHKRRSAPDYREKVMARRNKQQENLRKSKTVVNFPDMLRPNPDEIQQFFLRELQRGEQLLAEG